LTCAEFLKLARKFVFLGTRSSWLHKSVVVVVGKIFTPCFQIRVAEFLVSTKACDYDQTKQR
jgi:hypothetical protein